MSALPSAGDGSTEGKTLELVKLFYEEKELQLEKKNHKSDKIITKNQVGMAYTESLIMLH